MAAYYIKTPLGRLIKEGRETKWFHNEDQAREYLDKICPPGLTHKDLLKQGYQILVST